MKKCPKCNAEVDENFDLCWSCQYSFSENKIFTDEDFMQVCPKCKSELDMQLPSCPSCGYIFKFEKPTEEDKKEIKNISCLRCHVPMLFQGNFRFHEGTRMGALGDVFELFTNRESFDLYSCPSCGKVEFFIPGY